VHEKKQTPQEECTLVKFNPLKSGKLTTLQTDPDLSGYIPLEIRLHPAVAEWLAAQSAARGLPLDVLINALLLKECG
jgi:hypothetical protein